MLNPKPHELRRDAFAEQEFLFDFRSTGLKWAAYAGIAGALIYSTFFILSLVRYESVGVIGYVRLSVVGVLLFASFIVLKLNLATEKIYPVVVGFASVFALFGTVTIAHFAARISPEIVLSVPVAFIFGLFLHYSFLRLPLPLAAAIGWSSAVSAVLLTPSALGGDTLRHAIYLIFTNVFGMFICHLIESRERELFYQRRSAEAAWSEARKRQAEAEEAVLQKTRLVAAVSHDLRQPMTAAAIHLDVLRRRLEGDDLAGAIAQGDKARAAIHSLGGTLDHLLTAARYERSAEFIHLEWLDLNGMLESIHESFAAQAAERGLALRLRLSSRPLLVYTDRRSFERIVSNLVGNALKFTVPGVEGEGGVLIGVRRRTGTCLIEVVDTGIGIAADKQSEIWQPYTQLNQIERHRERGLGLGLYLVRLIVDQLSGHSISMRSVEGHGSRFILSLQAKPAAAEVATPERPARVPGALDLTPLYGAYVMLLEDDRDARAAMVELFDEWGMEVVSGATLGELLDNHGDAERFVDAIVCDYRLPGGVTGFDAIKSIRQRLEYSPHAIVVTGESEIDPLIPMAGRDTIVHQKPLSAELLAASLLQAVAASSRLHEG